MRGFLPRRGRRLFAFAGTGAAALAIAAGGGANPSLPDVAQLRAHASSLASRTHTALLDLYAAETQLTAADGRVTALRRELAQVRAQRALVAQEVAIAARAQRVSERRLAAHATALYEQGQPDPLATILGASSIDDALTSLEALDRVAKQDRFVARAAVAARRKLADLSAQLAGRTAELENAERRAAASVVELERARAQRSALVAALRSQQRFTQTRISTLEAKVRAARVKTQQLAPAAAAPASIEPAAATPADGLADTPAAPASSAAQVGRALTVVATGYSLPGQTATGLPVGWGIAAVDPAVIPLGTHMTVPGYGDAVAADVGNGVRGAMIDLWFPTLTQARAWGRRTVTISLH